MRIISLTILSCILFGKVNGQSAEADQVKIAFNAYKSAILNDNSEAALNAVDSRTITYYTEILNAVKNADSTKISTLSLIDKITILSIRSKASKEEILLMKGSDLFIYAINNGMVGKNGVINASIGEVKIDSSFAKAQLVANGEELPFYFHFYKEGGKWKLDITALFSISNDSLKNMVGKSGKTENEFIIMVLENLTGKKLGSEIWKPVI